MIQILVKGDDIITGTKANTHHGRHRRQWVKIKNTFNRCFPKARKLNSLHHNRLDAENTFRIFWLVVYKPGNFVFGNKQRFIIFSQDSTIS